MSNVTNKQKELLKQLNTNQSEIGVMVKDSIKKATESGGILTELKASVKHGEWGNFVKEHLPDISERQCNKYMLIFENRELLESEPKFRFGSISEAASFISEQLKDKKAISNIAKAAVEAVKRRDSVPSVEPVNNHTRAEDIAKKRKATRRKNDASRRKYIALTMKQKKHIYELIGTVETVYGESDIPDDLHNWLEQGKEILNGIESELSNAA